MTHSLEDDIRLLIGMVNAKKADRAAYLHLVEVDVSSAIHDDFRVFTGAAIHLIERLAGDVAQLCETTRGEVLQSFLTRIDELSGEGFDYSGEHQ